MKKDWEYKTLKEISIIYGNYGLSVSSIPYNGVRYLRITDITENGELNDDKVSADISSGKTQEELQEGDILFARTGATVGKTLIYRKEFGKCLFAGYLIRYRLNKDIVIPQFIHHFTHSSGYYKWVSSNQKAAAQPNIGAKIYNELRIPVPPLSEQKDIVEYLDSSFAKIDKLKENAAKNLEEAKALFQSALKDAFEPKEGWEEKTMDEIVDINTPISYGIVQPGDDVPDGIPVVRPVDLIAKNISLNDNIKRTAKENSESYKRTILNGKEILMCVRGTTGIVSLTDETLKNCNVTRGIVPLKITDETLRLFVYYTIIAPVASEYIQHNTKGAALKQINIADVKKIPVALPSPQEQQSIVSFLDSLNEKVNTLQQNYSRICDECDALKQAILRQVFE